MGCSPANVFYDAYQALDADVTHLLDPGSGGTVAIEDADNAILVMESAGARTLESATRIPLGVQVLALAQAAVTVNGLSLADGEHAVFRVTLDSSGAKQWVVTAFSTVPFIPDAQQEDAPAPGAISVATYFTSITTEGAEAFSLADGGQKGQLKKIMLTVTAGDATLTITTPEDENTVVFSVVGDTVELLWNGAAWRIIAAYNQATGAITTPVLSTV